ncbi:uncharacterized protein METZ01_LOCUS440913, partial [marine metagenome]
MSAESSGTFDKSTQLLPHKFLLFFLKCGKVLTINTVWSHRAHCL